MANLGNDITTIEEGEEDDKERIRTAVDAEQSVRTLPYRRCQVPNGSPCDS